MPVGVLEGDLVGLSLAMVARFLPLIFLSYFTLEPWGLALGAALFFEFKEAWAGFGQKEMVTFM